MPFLCCVPRCNGNHPNGPKVSVFTFPHDEELRKKWLQAIHRNGFKPSKASKVKNGHIRRVIDEEVKSLVLEISGTNVATTYITCPIKPRASLGVRLPFLVMIIKNMNKYFTFEIQILDDKDMHRRFRVSNFQSTTKVRPFCTTMPIGLSKGWNQVQFNLADFTKRAYGSTYLETQRVQIHANVRIRRIYFADQLYSEEDLPNEFKLFIPSTAAGQKRDSKSGPDAKKDSKSSFDKAVGQVPSGALPTPAEVTPRAEEGESGPAPDQPQEEKPPEETGDQPPEEAAAPVEQAGDEISDIGHSIQVDDTGELPPPEPSEVGEEIAQEPTDVPAEGPTEAPPEGEAEAPSDVPPEAPTEEGTEIKLEEVSEAPAAPDEPVTPTTEATTEVTETDGGATTEGPTEDEGEATDATATETSPGEESP